MFQRTMEDFVEDMISDGRKWKYIFAVVVNSRWLGKIHEIKEIYKKMKKKRKI